MVRHPFYFPASTVLLIVSGIMIGSPGAAGRPGGALARRCLTGDGLRSGDPWSSALKVAVVGPTHPYKGGVAAHTTSLAHQLAEAGHDVTLVSWSHLYPARLYPGEQAVPGGAPDVPPVPAHRPGAVAGPVPTRGCAPDAGCAASTSVIVVHVIPPVVPAHLALLRAAGVRVRGRGRDRATTCCRTRAHPGDRQLMHALLDRVDAVLVHSAEQAGLAADLGAARVSVADLPPHLPGGVARRARADDGPPRLLALGMVREYKGVDVLLRALRQVPGVTLTVAGELWGTSGTTVRQLAAEPDLRDRVRCCPATSPPTGWPSCWPATTCSP